MRYTKNCHKCNKATTHDDHGCTICEKNRTKIAYALNTADFRQLSYEKLCEIVKIMKRK